MGWWRLSIACLIFLSSWQSMAQDVSLTLAVQPQVVRRGQEATVQMRLRNPNLSETITLKAVASYTDAAGVQRVVESNEVRLTVDASLPVRLELPADRVRVVPGTIVYDGNPVQAAGNSIVVDIILPGDGAEHVLEMRIIR